MWLHIWVPQAVGSGIQQIYKEMIESKGMTLRIVTECGRYITGPAGMLVSRVTHRKKIYKNYAPCLQRTFASCEKTVLYDESQHFWWDFLSNLGCFN